MKLSLVSTQGGVVRLRCEGDINVELNNVKNNPIEEVLGMGCYGNKVLVDLEHATHMNSTGVAWLIRCHKNFEQAGGRFVLHSIPPLIDHALRLLNLHTYLHMAENESAALALVQGKNS